MQRQLNKGKLLIVLKKKSPVLKGNAREYISFLNMAKKNLTGSERNLENRVKEMLGAGLLKPEQYMQVTEQVKQLSGKIAREKHEAYLSLEQNFGEFIAARKAEAVGSTDQVCIWASDGGMHLEYIAQSEAIGMGLLNQSLDFPFMGAEEMERQMDLFSAAAKCGFALERAVTHTYLICKSMGIPVSGQVQALLSEGLIFETVRENYAEQELSREISALAQIAEGELAAELLKTLQPGKWEKYLEECLAPLVQVSEAPKSRPSFPKEHFSLAGKLMAEYPDAEFSGDYVQGLGESCGWDEEKAAAVMEMELSGIGREDALALASEKEWDVIPKHNLMAPVLEEAGILHSDVHYAFGLLSEEQCWDLGEKLQEYQEWMELMPGDWRELEKQQASAILALSITPAKERKGAPALLEEYEDSLLETLLETEGDAEHAEKTLGRYGKYCNRFLEGEKEPEKEKSRQTRRKKGRIMRPHESLCFPAHAEQYIESKGILVENVKRALIYGLRLSSRKSAIGGKYMPITGFMQNTRTVLSREAGDPNTRVGAIKDFLYKEGIISYYKNGNVIMLNMKAEVGQHNEPSEVGQQILDSVVGWKVEFDRKTKGNGS